MTNNDEEVVEVEFDRSKRKVVIATLGFTGAACEAETRLLKEELGGEVIRDERTADYGKAKPATKTNRVGVQQKK